MIPAGTDVSFKNKILFVQPETAEATKLHIQEQLFCTNFIKTWPKKWSKTHQIQFGLSRHCSHDRRVWFVQNKPSIWHIKCEKYSGSTCWWLLFKRFSLVSASLLLLSWYFTFRFPQIITTVYWLHTWTSPMNFLAVYATFTFFTIRIAPCRYHLFIETWAEQTVWFTAWKASNTSSVTFIRSYIRIQPSPSASLTV